MKKFAKTTICRYLGAFNPTVNEINDTFSNDNPFTVEYFSVPDETSETGLGLFAVYTVETGSSNQ